MNHKRDEVVPQKSVSKFEMKRRIHGNLQINGSSIFLLIYCIKNLNNISNQKLNQLSPAMRIREVMG